MSWITILINYIIIGVICNALYDLSIDRIQKEELRFNMLERIMFTFIWPVYALLFLYNFILTIINKNDD